MAQPLIIDCDPGVDDAIALLLAMASPELNLLGITTVAGNVPLHHTQTNARKICELAGRGDVPVFAGCPRPLVRSLITAEAVHGETGLDGASLPEPILPLQAQHGVAFLLDTLRTASEPITLAALGPLTNLAVAMIQEPSLFRRVREIVIMGGAITHGNITPVAEFNSYVDPHAAQVVLSSGVPITLITLDVTHQVLTTPERLQAIRAIATPVATAAADLLTYYGKHDAARYGMPGSPLHDPCVIAYLLQPALFTGQQAHVMVELQSEATLGQTVVDLWQVGDRPPNVNVLRTVDAAGVYRLLIERLSSL
jgi:purine nucleosidase